LRNWVAVRFRCHGGYLRITIPSDGRAAVARCPVCGAEARFVRGEGGTTSKFFEVGS
jgi:hypothetical protein